MKNKVELTVKGMTCNHCVMAVTKALESVEGVEKVKVNLNKGKAKIKTKTDVDNNLLADAVKEAGYEAEVE